MSPAALIRLSHAGRAVNLTADTLDRAIRRGDVPLKVYRFNGFRYLNASEFEKWCASMALPGAHQSTPPKS